MTAVIRRSIVNTRPMTPQVTTEQRQQSLHVTHTGLFTSVDVTSCRHAIQLACKIAEILGHKIYIHWISKKRQYDFSKRFVWLENPI